MERIFLEILGAAVAGKTWQGSDLTGEQWTQVLALAKRHDVLPMVYQAVYRQPSAAALPGAIKMAVRQQVITQTMKTEAFLALYRYLREKQIPCMVVKGILCRSLYPNPDHRRSSDEDLIVPPEAYDAACEALEAYGMTCAAEDPEERDYRMAGSPLHIELHANLFVTDSEAYGDWNRLFTGFWDRAVCREFGDVEILGPNHTDHLLYLICHAYKHFLHSGFGLRQVADMALYANAWGSEICWEHVLEKCQQIRGAHFAATLFAIAERYLTFDPVRACYPASWKEYALETDPLLEDLFGAGVFGGATESRRHSSNMTLNAVTEGKPNLLSQVFPPKRKLEKQFPYLQDKGWLLPVAWTQRLWRYATNLRKDNDPTEAVKIGNQRVALLRQYKIID